MDEIIKSCKATHGKYNLDTGNVVIQVDVELDTKEITKNIAIEVENFLAEAPELKQQRDELFIRAKSYLNSLKYAEENRVVESYKKALQDIVKETEGAD